MDQRDYISKTEEEIRRDFAMAFDRLVRAGQAYDAGHHSEALALAALVYLFVHDKGRSTVSLLTMVSRKDIGFRDTGVPVNPRNLITEHPLAVSRMEVEHLQYLPALGETQGFVGDKDARFLRAAERADREARTLCMTLAYGGCRLSEALALTADRVDLGAIRLSSVTSAPRGQPIPAAAARARYSRTVLGAMPSSCPIARVLAPALK